jgi:hypothetical protein
MTANRLCRRGNARINPGEHLLKQKRWGISVVECGHHLQGPSNRIGEASATSSASACSSGSPPDFTRLRLGEHKTGDIIQDFFCRRRGALIL